MSDVIDESEIYEIKDNITKAIAKKSKDYMITYNDGLEDCIVRKDFIDDCFIFIIRGKYRFVFYRDQQERRLKEKDIVKYSKLVDGIFKEVKQNETRKL